MQQPQSRYRRTERGEIWWKNISEHWSDPWLSSLDCMGSTQSEAQDRPAPMRLFMLQSQEGKKKKQRTSKSSDGISCSAWSHLTNHQRWRRHREGRNVENCTLSLGSLQSEYFCFYDFWKLQWEGKVAFRPTVKITLTQNPNWTAAISTLWEAQDFKLGQSPTCFRKTYWSLRHWRQCPGSIWNGEVGTVGFKNMSTNLLTAVFQRGTNSPFKVNGFSDTLYEER